MVARHQPPHEISLTHSDSGSAVQRFYKIARDENSNLLYQAGQARFTSAQIYSGRFSLENVDAENDVPMSFQTWRGGAGFVEADITKPGMDQVYHYTRGVDLSWRNRAYLSPQLQTGGTTSSSIPLKFIMSSLGLFCLTARYVFVWGGSSWTEVLDHGIATLTDIHEFRNGITTFIVVGVQGQASYVSTDGTAWAQSSSGTGAAPSFRAVDSTSTNGATSLTVTKPSGTVDDDVMFAVVATDAIEPIVAPTGWSQITSWASAVATTQAAFYWKRASSEGANYVWSWASSVAAEAMVVTYQNCATTSLPFEDWTGTGYGSGTSHNPAGVTVFGTNRTALVLSAASDDAGTAIQWTPPSGYTERFDSNDGPSVTVADDTTVSAGSVDPGAFTLDNAGEGASVVLALLPTVNVPTDVYRFTTRGSSGGYPVLWCVSRSGDVRNTTDPSVPSLWSSADQIQVGQGTGAGFFNEIAGFETMDNEMFLLSNDGIASYDGIESSTVWSSAGMQIGDLTDTFQPCRPLVWVDRRMYFSFAGALLRFEKNTNTIEKVWPRGGQMGNSELSGLIFAIAGDADNLYFVLKNNAGNYYIMKGDPRQPLTIDDETIYPFHTWAYRGTAYCEALFVAPTSDATFSTSNPQLVLGDSTSADYFILPRYNYRPEDDSNYRFDTAEGTATGSWVDAGARTYSKWLNRGRSINEGISASNPATYVALNYEIDASGTPVQVHQASANGITDTSLTASEVAFGRVRYSIDMDTSVNTSSPRCLGVVLNATLNPTRKRQWEIGVEIADNQQNLGGGPSRQNYANLRAHLFAAPTNRVTFVDLDGQTYYTHVSIAGISARPDGKGETFLLRLTEI